MSFNKIRQGRNNTNKMKLLKILTEQSERSFDTEQSSTDPETGTVTWNVVYTPLISLDKAMQKMYEDFADTIKEYPDDIRLEQMFYDFANIKKNLRTHITRKYKK
jgi:hypothetical protein